MEILRGCLVYGSKKAISCLFIDHIICFLLCEKEKKINKFLTRKKACH